MLIYKRNSFAHRMMGMMMLASGIALSMLVATLLTFDSITSRALVENRLTTLADVVGQNSTAALNFNDPPAAKDVLEALRAEPPVVYACLYDLSGSLFTEYRRARQEQSCPPRQSEIRATQADFLSVVRPVRRRGETVGALLVCSDLQNLERRWRQLLRMAFLLAMAALAVGTITGSVLQRRIAKPVLELARAMKRVTEEHNLETRIVVTGKDEIGQLSRGFNSMVSQLARREAEKKKAETRLQYQALNDELTGLPNRRLFSDRLTQTLIRAEREKGLVALLYIDLDGFKLVNDSLGHAIGDQLLKQVGSRLNARVRASDTLARLGGDEFSVVLNRVHEREEAALVASGILAMLADPFSIGTHEITIGASVGISIFPESATQAEDLLKQADAAMYAAKRNGKNQVMFFTPELGTAVRERMNLEKMLRHALAKGDIMVHYQPEFEIGTGRLVRFEALARWTHDTIGVISPARFIPVAEESGLIIPLGAYVMERACSEALQWQQMAGYPIQVAVNVSSLQFGRESFVREVKEILKSTGLAPNLLQIELTESIMLTGAGRASETMRELRELGVSLAIDDFGTGYSCLSYLPELPFDSLKIDRSFVNDLEKRPEIKAMVHSLITLAHNIGMRVIVEGVENEKQLQWIRRFGANEVQGYLMGKPTADPAAAIDAAAHASPPTSRCGRRVAAVSPNPATT
jgi:diguanylate cyclase (GGDEF)-like protein